MKLANAEELANTRFKLARLEARYEALARQQDGDARLRDMSMTSLKRVINQFKEEIAIYQSHRHSATARP